MADKDVSLGISAEDAGLNAAVNAAQRAVQNAASQMNTSFKSVGDTLGKVQGMFAIFTAALAGGAAFKEAIDASVNLTKESIALGKALGISATEASVLNLALDDTFQTSESFIDSNGKMTKQLLKNEDAFKNLGVATRDSNGNFRNSVDIQMDVNKRLLEFKEGVDRNIEGIKIYGKGWHDASATLRLTTEAMTAAKEKADALGLTIGQENVAATARYRSSMNDVHDVIKAVLKATGDALLPVLSQMGEWFSQVGPTAVAMTRQAMDVFMTTVQAVGTVIGALWDVATTAFSAIGSLVKMVFGDVSPMNVFTGALRLVSVAVISLRTIFELAFESINLILTGAMSFMMRFAKVAERALHLDFEGAKTAWKQGASDMEAIFGASVARMVAISEKGRTDIDTALFGDASKVTNTPIARKDMGGTSEGKDSKSGSSGKNSSRVSTWQAALEDAKVFYQANNNLREFSKEQEKEYWASILATNNASQQERLDISRKMSALDLGIMKQAIAQKRAMTTELIASTEKTALSGLQVDEERAKQEVALGRMDKQELLAIQIKYENQRFDIQTTAQQARISAMQGDPNYDPVALQKLLDQLTEIQNKHAVDVEKINTTMSLNVQQKWTDMMFPIRDAFDRTINGMIQGTLTWQKAVMNIGDNVAASFIKSGLNMAAAWAAAELQKTAATQTGSVMRFLLERAGLIATTAVGVASAAINIGTAKAEAKEVIPPEAAIAAGKAASSVADIPVVGPVLAAAAYAGIYNMVMGGLVSASAAGGYDIPAGMNPVTQLHAREMVLPAEHASSFRRFVSDVFTSAASAPGSGSSRRTGSLRSPCGQSRGLRSRRAGTTPARPSGARARRSARPRSRARVGRSCLAPRTAAV